MKSLDLQKIHMKKKNVIEYREFLFTCLPEEKTPYAYKGDISGLDEGILKSLDLRKFT